MGVLVIAGAHYACMYDSTDMVAFGPVFSHEETFGSAEAAVEDFIEWWYLRFGADGGDPRRRALVDLVQDRRLWLHERCHVGADSPAVREAMRKPPYGVDHFTNTEEDAAAWERAHNG